MTLFTKQNCYTILQFVKNVKIFIDFKKITFLSISKFKTTLPVNNEVQLCTVIKAKTVM